MGEKNERLRALYENLGRDLAQLMAGVDGGQVTCGGELMDGSTVFVTRHPGIIETVRQLSAPQKLLNDLPMVDGAFMLRTPVDFENACRRRIKDEQENPNSDTALIALLCDAVRVNREYHIQEQARLII